VQQDRRTGKQKKPKENGVEKLARLKAFCLQKNSNKVSWIDNFLGGSYQNLKAEESWRSMMMMMGLMTQSASHIV
jgi:hypothetical protein